MQDVHRAKYFLEGLTFGEWWEAVGGEEIAERRKGLSCVVKISNDHRLRDFDYATDNFVCCPVRGYGEVRFVHSLEQIAFSIRLDSPVRLGPELVVEGHRIRFFDIPTEI